jgi:hypothetical protein
LLADYVRQQSTGELVRNAATIYRRNFFTLVFPYLFVSISLAWVKLNGDIADDPALSFVLLCVEFVLSAVISGAATMIVSDVCLGHQPSLQRAYRFLVGARAWRVLGTSLLAGAMLGIGFVLFVVPAVVMYAAFITVIPVVLLEDRAGLNAISRSYTLSRGLLLRNLGVVLILLSPILVVTFLAVFLPGLVSLLWTSAEQLFQPEIILAIIQAIALPLMLILPVLIYYDERVRKEGYDSAALNDALRF